jgi:hypothetical protein
VASGSRIRRFALPSLATASIGRAFVPAAGLFMVLYYGAIMTVGRTWPYHLLFQPVDRGLTFNSMLEHLLAGRFDVDPGIITDEGFIEGGKVYSYFGIGPALLRLFLIPFGELHNLDITRLSCILGAATAGLFKVLAVLQVYRQCAPTKLSTGLFWALVLSIVLGGAQVTYLVPTIYQEPDAWGQALSAMFVYCAVRGLIVDHAFSQSLLLQMALVAGAALLTRVSYGVGLYAAFGLLVLTVAIGANVEKTTLGLLQTLCSRRFLVPMAASIVLAGVCGGVNYARWGSALTFADWHHYKYFFVQPERMVRFVKYGDFNPVRIPYALMYYFLPIWAIIRPDGRFMFDEFRQRYIDGNDLPPSSFFISDPLLVLLDIVFVVLWWRGRMQRDQFDGRASIALLVGLAAAPFLVLNAMDMAFRYRMEFYPVIELAAFLGMYAACTTSGPRTQSLLRNAAWPCAITGIVAAHLLVLTYSVSPVSMDFVGAVAKPDGIGHVGWVRFYLQRIDKK